MTIIGVNQRVLEWFEKRGISQETALRMGAYSGTRVRSGDDAGKVVPSATGNIIAFPFFENGIVVAEKYRTADKKFSQRPNPRKVFYNCDILGEPALRREEGALALVICEGEMDCLSFLEAGYDYAVSVPDGAPPARDAHGNLVDVPEDARDVDLENDEKYRYILNHWESLKGIRRIVIATDNDEPGRRLAAELVRRLGRVRCSFVVWPDGCKDANDVLVKLGPAALARLVWTAKEYPVSGVYRFSELPNEPDIETVSSGWSKLDNAMRLYHPALLVVSGRAGHGKTSWTQQLVAHLARDCGWNVAIASFEMRIKPFVSNALCSAYLGYAIERASTSDRERSFQFVEERFSFIAPEPDGRSSHDMDWLLEKAEAAVIRHGARVLLIDPWNEIEHARESRETATEYVNRALLALKAFARQFDVLTIVVSHPTKSGAQKDPSELTLYDIADSAAFQNKADLGVIVTRLSEDQGGNTEIKVSKVRYQPLCGIPATEKLAFDRESRLFF